MILVFLEIIEIIIVFVHQNNTKRNINERASSDATNEIVLNIVRNEEVLQEQTGDKMPLDSDLDNSLLYI